MIRHIPNQRPSCVIVATGLCRWVRHVQHASTCTQLRDTPSRSDVCARHSSTRARQRVPRRSIAGLTGLVAMVLGAGCASAPVAQSDQELRETAVRYIRAGARFPENPAVRAQGIEAVSQVLPPQEASVLIREGLRDEHAGVRFAACMALGEIKNTDARPAIEPLAEDPDASVRVAAYCALEQLGDFSHRRQWVDALRRHPDPSVRRNAALALGRLGNAAVLTFLERASMEDEDEGVRLQALEAMAHLGDSYAVSRFIHDAHGGLGFKQPFALLTLGHIRGEQVLATLHSRLRHAPYLEARLASARGLGMQGHDDGYELAVASLKWSSPIQGLADDLPENQIMRVRSMAALALGDIGKREALEPLARLMQSEQDPRVQLAAATAIVMILDRTSAP